jgi:hypothetical protein
MDWLEVHSPMQVDWLNKWMSITLVGAVIQLQGVKPLMPDQSVVGVYWVSQDISSIPHLCCLIQSDLPEQIQQLLDKFAFLFDEHFCALDIFALLCPFLS